MPLLVHFRAKARTALALGLPNLWRVLVYRLGASPPTVSRPAPFAQGGSSVLRRGQAFALLRFPRSRFRPSQADALHVDLWVAGHNLLRDAGSYS